MIVPWALRFGRRFLSRTIARRNAMNSRTMRVMRSVRIVEHQCASSPTVMSPLRSAPSAIMSVTNGNSLRSGIQRRAVGSVLDRRGDVQLERQRREFTSLCDRVRVLYGRNPLGYRLDESDLDTGSRIVRSRHDKQSVPRTLLQAEHA